jgi:uncharacterized membrane protein
MLKLVKATFVGGVLFLLPLGIVVVIMGRLFVHARQSGQIVHDALFPASENVFLPLLFAVLMLLLLALAAGAFVQTGMGRGLFRKLEATVLSRLPLYTVMSDLVTDMLGGASHLAPTRDRELEVVRVTMDDHEVLGFLVDRGKAGKSVVYLPGAPSVLSGTVILVEDHRISTTGLQAAQVMAAMRRLGSGLVTLERASAPQGAKG